MWRPSALALCSWSLLGCGASARAPEPPTVEIAPLPRASAAAEESSGAPASDATCVIHSEAYFPPEPIALQTSAGIPFARITSAASIELRFSPIPVLTTTTYGVRLVTTPTAAFLPIYAKEPLLLGGVLTPGGMTKLSWTIEGATLLVSTRPDPRLVWEGDAPKAILPCAQASLEEIVRDGDPGEGNESLRAGTIALAPTSSAQPVAKLVLPERTAVAVSQKENGRAHIVLWLGDDNLRGSRLEGWVSVADLAGVMALAGGLAGASFGGLEGTSDWTGCRANVPLFVRLGGRPEPIGHVLAGTRVRLLDGEEGALTEVEILGPSVREVPSPLTLVGGARLFMPKSDAERCH